MARTPSPQVAEAPLARYNAKRDFSGTDEPKGRVSRRKSKQLAFVVQKHWASHLHYDFRLELDGVMLSWAVPKGPSLDPAVKRMAIHVENHPLSYNSFEGTIPKGHYGAGKVVIWDRGSWEPMGDPHEGLKKGKLAFQLHSEKLTGAWELVRIAKPGDKQEAWLLIKKREPRAAAAAPSDSGPDLSRATKARLPSSLAPQLATLVAAPPSADSWVIENKWDGYRVMVKVAAGKVRLHTRSGNDWTSKLRPLADELEQIGIDKGWLDGEMVILNEKGIPDFNRLQNAIDKERSQEIVLYLFDLPFLGDRDLRQVPLRSRRMVLRELLKGAASDRIRFSEELPSEPSQVLEAACRIGLEGVMLKRADAAYVSGRSDSWLKLKCQRRQEFVVLGYTDRANTHREIGSLLLGFHDDAGQLQSAGSVGTGWTSAQRAELHRELAALQVKTPAIEAEALSGTRWSGRASRTVHWVKPRLVVEIAFGEWTPDGRIRHASYIAQREDKPARAIGRERPIDEAIDEPIAQVRISNPDRVIDVSTGTRKIDLVHYYESMAERILPHLRDRPVALLRAPKGIGGSLFFQKHSEAKLPGVTELDRKLWPEHEPLLAVDTIEGLIGAAQMNVIEFHTWNSRVRRIDIPDRIVFDLDPGEGVGWARVREAAMLTCTLLEELALRSWLKTSGGKGLHVVVPLAPKLGFDEVKAFSRAVVLHMAKTLPRHFVAKSGAGNRKGKIFIDYLRNGHGQTTAAAFSARARPGLGVSMPISWDALPVLKRSDQWTIADAREYLSFEAEDPWADYWKSRQTLTHARKLLQLT